MKKPVSLSGTQLHNELWFEKEKQKTQEKCSMSNAWINASWFKPWLNVKVNLENLSLRNIFSFYYTCMISEHDSLADILFMAMIYIFYLCPAGGSEIKAYLPCILFSLNSLPRPTTYQICERNFHSKPDLSFVIFFHVSAIHKVYYV